MEEWNEYRIGGMGCKGRRINGTNGLKGQQALSRGLLDLARSILGERPGHTHQTNPPCFLA